MNTFQGPFDVGAFPDKLTATSVTPDVAPLLEGYPLLTDLAQKKSFTETVWLALQGELPDANEAWAFEQALYWLSPIHIGEAPTHASYVARLCDSWTSASLSVGAIGLAERARTLNERFSEWIIFLQAPSNQQIPPIAFDADNNTELRQAREALFSEWTHRFGRNDLFAPQLNYCREAVALLLLSQLGLCSQLNIEFLSMWAAFPLVLAELKNAKPTELFSYPARLPEIQYVELNTL
jgi:hypothetical protein